MRWLMKARWVRELRWLDEVRARRRKRKRDRTRAAIYLAMMGTPPTRRATGRMARILRGDR